MAFMSSLLTVGYTKIRNKDLSSSTLQDQSITFFVYIPYPQYQQKNSIQVNENPAQTLESIRPQMK